MQSVSQVTTLSQLLLIVLTVFAGCLHTCVCAQIPSRFYYDNQQNSDGLADAAGDTKDLNLHVGAADADPIPLEFYEQLDNVSDISEFIERFVDKDSIDPQLGIQENLKRNVERASAVIPKAANCIPESTIVPLTPLNPSKDPKIIYYPKCTRVKRCSGCCSSELMSCKPTETEVINFEVTKYRYGEKTPLHGKEIILVEEHKRCKCACRIMPEDCNSYQIYRPELCRCVCTNDDALRKCLAQEHKIWDEQSCRCVCRDSQSCTTGTIFDESQCKCVDPITNGTEPAALDRRRFIIKAVPVEPSDSTIYTHV